MLKCDNHMLLNQLLITHAPRLRKPCISNDLLTPQDRLTCVKFGQELHRDRLYCVYNGCGDRQLRREHIFWDLKHVEVSEMSTYKCRLIRKIVYAMYRDRIRDLYDKYVDISGVSRYPMSR